MKASKGKDYAAPSRAELEAMRAEKMQLVPNGEAGRRERKLLEHYSAAQADLQWIVDNNAWHELGFDTFTGWYADRVRPAVAAAGLRPTQEFALYVLENVQSDEAALPKQQRLLQRELADLVGVSVSTLRRLSQDPPQTSNGAGVDLEDAPDPADIADALTQAIQETAAHTSSASVAVVDTSRAAGEPDGSVKVAESSGTPLEDLGEDERDAALERLVGFPADHVGRRHYNRRGETVCHHDRREPRTPVLDQVDCMDCLRITAGINSPAAVTESDPTTQLASLPQPGQDSPTGQEEPGDAGASADATAGRSETDPPVVADQPIATEARPGIDHHDGAGVSPRGEALPEESRPSGALELEDGGPAQDPPSSSDTLTVGDRLMYLVSAFVLQLDGFDADAVGPMLGADDLHTLDEHAEQLATFIRRVRKTQFTEMTHTP